MKTREASKEKLTEIEKEKRIFRKPYSRGLLVYPVRSLSPSGTTYYDLPLSGSFGMGRPRRGRNGWYDRYTEGWVPAPCISVLSDHGSRQYRRKYARALVALIHRSSWIVTFFIHKSPSNCTILSLKFFWVPFRLYRRFSGKSRILPILV